MDYQNPVLSDLFDEVVCKRIPSAKIRFKDKSVFMRFLGILLFFNKRFMTDYITVIFNTVYFPSREWLGAHTHSSVTILAHEYVHMVDSSKNKLFSILYLFPQILAVFAVFSFLSPWFLLALVCLFPLPAPWRVNSEVNGYTMNMVFEQVLAPVGYNVRVAADLYAAKFVSSGYYWMAYRKAPVARKLEKAFKELPTTHSAFIEVLEWLKTRKL